MPSSYEAYSSLLQKSFTTAQDHFFNEQDLARLLKGSGLDIGSIDYTPGYWTGAYLSWSQFLLFLRRGKTVSQRGFLAKYFFFTLLRCLDGRKYPGGILCIASKSAEE